MADTTMFALFALLLLLGCGNVAPAEDAAADGSEYVGPSGCEGAVPKCAELGGRALDDYGGTCDRVAGCFGYFRCMGTPNPCDTWRLPPTNSLCTFEKGCTEPMFANDAAIPPDASCLGTPLPCSQQDCYDGSGCHWQTCDGEATPCAALNAPDVCTRQPGCVWRYPHPIHPRCTGTTLPCYAQPSCDAVGCYPDMHCDGVAPTTCDTATGCLLDGCRLDISTGLCAGSPAPCWALQFCSFHAPGCGLRSCGGQPRPCESFDTQNDCTRQPGCSWN